MNRRKTTPRGRRQGTVREDGEIPGWILGVAFALALLAATWVFTGPALSRWLHELGA